MVYGGGAVSTFRKGEDHSKLLNDAAFAKVLVTFNGIRFDQRFLRKEFPQINLPEVHVDLMYLCRRVGLTGGQKRIENELDLHFRDDLADVDGLAAVLLWHRYLRGDIDALKKLIRYNRADIAAMGAIFDEAQARLNIDPDFFSKTVKYQEWSAPNGWRKVPACLKPASLELTKAPLFGQIFGGTPAASARVVGIDLTGSEARATGWCLLEGDKADTTMLSTDAEIIERTLTANPTIVSIDSPLCLPKGRIVVEDSDPGRDEFGIMRQCERELKRRGVNVYPSLLPSMQKLTARGIRLAQIFRNKGIPVIESYPGAAQDIMRIPRKGAGIEWLKLGLSAFGIKGKYQSYQVTHDELDAITSALVGTFHLAGFSEALGTVDEPPMIVPDLKGTPRPIVIGISGPIAAGKTTLARYFENNGFAYTRFSLVIDEKLKDSGLALNRENKQRIGNEINKTGGQRLLDYLVLSRVKGAKKVVIDGIRFPEDYSFFVEEYGTNFFHIFIDAETSIRKYRYKLRGLDGNFLDAENAQVEGRVCELRLLSHKKIENNCDKGALKHKVDKFTDQMNGRTKCLFQL